MKNDIWEKQKYKPLKWIILSCVILIIFLVLFLTYRKINLMIGEDIVINISPYETVLNLSHGESANISLKVSVNNNALCTAECVQSFTGNEYSRFTFKNSDQIIFSKILIASKPGYGKELSTYTLECKNIADNICPSGNDTFRRTAIIVINHHPNYAELDLINHIEQVFGIVSEEISYSESKILSSQDILKKFPQVNFLDYNDRAFTLKDALVNAKSRQSELSNRWIADNYTGAQEVLDTLVPISSGLKIQADTLYMDTSEKVHQFNDAVSMIDYLRASYSSKLASYPAYSEKDYTEYYVRLYDWIDMLDSASIAIDSGISSYDQKEYQSLSQSLYVIKQEYIKRAYSSGIAASYLMRRMICQNKQEDCSGIIDNYTGFGSIEQAYAYDADRCSEDIDSIDYIDSYNHTTTAKDKIDEMIIMSGMLEELRNSSNNTLVLYDIDNYLTIIKRGIPENYSMNPFNGSEHHSFGLDFSFMRSDIEQRQRNCQRNLSIKGPKDLSSFNIVLPEEILINPERLQNLSFTCCSQGCSRCIDDPRPLIMLHGHSFNAKTSAFQSTEIFNSLEDYLGNKYSSLGTPESYIYSDKDSWSMNKDIMLKPTYYITGYTNNFGIISSEGKKGNIDSYAIRLKEIIDYTKYKTGSDKVDIVAHSMGGLVVRRYIQIFHEDSIGKLILIGTPNQGIEDGIYNYCKLFGEVNECDDMRINSTLIISLNDPANQPIMSKTYIIAGSGCSINGKDGDGVVTLESAKLPDATAIIINGTCQGSSLLHNDLMSRYPEVQQAIAKILR